jgi:hypothetical protein
MRAGTIGLLVGGGLLLLAVLGVGLFLLLRPGATEVEIADAPAAEVPDIEVTLRWTSEADLDLQVFDPEGAGVSHARPRVSSGGSLERDANRGCESPTSTPVERIGWAESRAQTGAYFVQVSYPHECGDATGVQAYTLSVVLQGETVAMVSDEIDHGEVVDLLAFSFPAGIVDDWREFDEAPDASPPPQPARETEPEEAPEPRLPEQPPAEVYDLPSGLFCRDLSAMGYPYWDAVAYWEFEGRPSRMDEAGNGIPCETVYPRQAVVDYWGLEGDGGFQEGGDVPEEWDYYEDGGHWEDEHLWWEEEELPDL